MQKIKKIVKKNWDEIGIATALGHFYTHGSDINMEEHGYVIEALRRSQTKLQDANIDELHDYVASLDESQLPGLVSNIKGIAHEIHYVEIENEDGDSTSAYMFSDTNHKDFDVVLYNESGNTEYLQLKATDSTQYANEAIENLGADKVVLTEELAEKMNVKSSGISNKELQADVETVVDKLMVDSSLWNYVPALSAWSIALIAASLTKRYINKEVRRKEYITLMTVYCGAKVTKIAIIIAALSIPGVNIIAGALLFLKVAFSAKSVYS